MPLISQLLTTPVKKRIQNPIDRAVSLACLLHHSQACSIFQIRTICSGAPTERGSEQNKPNLKTIEESCRPPNISQSSPRQKPNLHKAAETLRIKPKI